VVWDAASLAPVRTYARPHRYGCAAIAFSSDGSRIATAASAKPESSHFSNGDDSFAPSAATEKASGLLWQEICIWDWAEEITKEEGLAIDGNVALASARSRIPASDPILHIAFHQEDSSLIVATGAERVTFLGLEESTGPSKGSNSSSLLLRFVAPAVPRGALDRPVAAFTCSTFLPGTAAALSATQDGSVLLWDAPPAAVLEGRVLDKAAVKAVRLAEAPEDEDATVIRKGGEEEGAGSAITWMDTVTLPEASDAQLGATGVGTGTIRHGDSEGGKEGGSKAESVVFVGTEDGVIRVFDTALRLLAWAEDLDAGPITSISFEVGGGHFQQSTDSLQGGNHVGAASLPPFIVATSRALVLSVDPSAAFGALDADARRGQLVL